MPTVWQLLKLAQDAKRPGAGETTTYPAAMSVLGIGWESKAVSARRRRERDAAVAVEVLQLTCEKCDTGDGQPCTTKTGWAADKAHL